MRVQDTNGFVKKALLIHGHKYDYDRSVYVDAKNVKVEIICKVHGSFWQTPEAHYSRGCPECSKGSVNGRAMSKEEFVFRAKKVHRNRYDYRKTEYINRRRKVCVTCRIHGDFFPYPMNHLSGGGCPACAGVERYTKDVFVRRAKSVYGNRYDFTDTVVDGCFDLVQIRCRTHGVFSIRANTFLAGRSKCPECRKEELARNFIERANKKHKGKYDYSLVRYKSSDRKVCIVCSHHGRFYQTPKTHVFGAGCPSCWKQRRRKATEDFIREARRIHGNQYCYDESRYDGINKKVSIICREHGEFWQLAQNHLVGQGCPKCKECKGEELVAWVLKEMGEKYERQKVFKGCHDKRILPFDFWIPKRKMLIEFDGVQHFYPTSFSKNKTVEYRKRCFRIVKKHDAIRDRFAKESGYKLIRIPYWRLNMKNGVERFLERVFL